MIPSTIKDKITTAKKDLGKFICSEFVQKRNLTTNPYSLACTFINSQIWIIVCMSYWLNGKSTIKLGVVSSPSAGKDENVQVRSINKFCCSDIHLWDMSVCLEEIQDMWPLPYWESHNDFVCHLLMSGNQLLACRTSEVAPDGHGLIRNEH